MSDNGVEFVSLPDASELLGVSYQTLLRKKAEYGAVRIDAPSRIEYAIPVNFIREYIEMELDKVRNRLNRLDNLEQDASGIWERGEEASSRAEEMAHLRFEKLWTLQEIGDEYGISRERVRQILGNTGTGYKSTRMREKARELTDKTNEEVAEELGMSEGYVAILRADLRTPAKGGAIKVGAKMEEWVAAELEDRGLDCELMPLHHPFDILVEDSCRVDVKFSKTPKNSPSHEAVSPTWRFGVRGDRENCDFYFCVTAERDSFVIPSTKVPETMESLVFVYPTKRPELAKWQKYHERHDLIENFIQNGHNGHR